MTIKYTDADGVPHVLETEPGAGGAERPVHGLGASIVNIFDAIKDAVEGTLAVADSIVAGKLDTLIGHVDGLEGTLSSILTAVGTTLAGYLDGVEGKLDTLHTDLGTTLHADLDGVEGKLDTVHADLVPPSAGFYGASTVGTTAAQIDSGTSHALIRGARIYNTHATQFLYVGLSNAVTDANGVKLAPGDFAPVPIDNLNKIWLYGSAASTAYRYLAF